LYRQEVPADVRENIKNRILEAALDDFEDYLLLVNSIIADILAGDIHPEVAKEARAYLELALTAITAKSMQDAGKGGSAEVTARISGIRKKRGVLPAPVPEITIDLTQRATVPAAPWEQE
tara:strand:+ start:665 stop:1024 length:360 start_codon:yes stop_codon:yes gene_type:complete